MKTFLVRLCLLILASTFVGNCYAKRFKESDAQIKQLQLFTVKDLDAGKEALLGIEITRIDRKRPRPDRAGFIDSSAGLTELHLQIGQVDPNSNKINGPVKHQILIELERSKEYLPQISFDDGDIMFWYQDQIDETEATDVTRTGITIYELIEYNEIREKDRQLRLENRGRHDEYFDLGREYPNQF